VSGLTREPALGRRPCIARGQLTRPDAFLVGQQRVGQVIDQDRDPDAVDRLELEEIEIRHNSHITAG
jgi:hypothetical protein